jgi:hypothetical protein
MDIQNATFTNPSNSTINADVDGTQMSIPVVVGNRHYDEIVAQSIIVAPYVKPLNESREELYQAANTEWVTRSATLLNLKVRGSSPEQALTARTMREMQRGGPNANAIATMHDKLDTLKDLIEAAEDQAALDLINVFNNAHWTV